MPVLSNVRHEIFAQEIAKGASASAAYVTAGYARNDGNAARLKGNEQVGARIAELKDAGAAIAIQAVAVTEERILRVSTHGVRGLAERRQAPMVPSTVLNVPAPEVRRAVATTVRTAASPLARRA